MSDNFKQSADKILANLKRRGFDAYFCETSAEATALALDLTDKNGTTSWGGSMTLSQIGLFDKLRAGGFNLIDRDTAKTAEERTELMRSALLCDTFFMSANAMSADGVLVNIDGNGNRVAAMCYGPKSVIVIVGRNKVCDTLEEAEHRARNVAAPLNVKRFGFTKTGCQNGKCTDCLGGECICSYIIKTRKSNIAGRIKIILVDEDLGF
ncbi:MAG: lactate utilization protein [Clostridia bacterium]|nr:lactate utilization protein [Clostridia bacterium]